MPCKRSAELSYSPWKRFVIVSGFRGCRFEFDNRRIRPQSLELVVVPGLLIKDMNNHVAVVQEHPSGVFPPLSPQRLPIEICLESALSVVGESPNVTIRCTRGDDKDVGDDQQLRDVEQHNIQPLLVIDRGCGRKGRFDGF